MLLLMRIPPFTRYALLFDHGFCHDRRHWTLMHTPVSTLFPAPAILLFEMYPDNRSQADRPEGWEAYTSWMQQEPFYRFPGAAK